MVHGYNIEANIRHVDNILGSNGRKLIYNSNDNKQNYPYCTFWLNS